MAYDVLVIGGGVNGCAIARDAAGRGLSVLLCEKRDLASGTSSASTKLIHGGLRYLEHYEFRLVREALIEREVLLKAAPHIIRPLRFVLPHHKGLRPRLLIRLGLFLYDHLGGRDILPGTRGVDLRSDRVGEPLKPDFSRGYEYSDCWVDDARLVVLNARDAAAKGAVIKTRARCVSARREGPLWSATIEHKDKAETVHARAIVNAAGPWVGSVLGEVFGGNADYKIRMVKGSHLVVDRLYDHDRCYIFQNADGRICFAIPYERDFTLIGTTDEDYFDDPGRAQITPDETEYLLRSVSGYFRTRVTADKIRWSYSGVRPLFDDGASKAQEATRDYVLKLDHAHNLTPLVCVFGGKITTARKLAEAVMDALKPFAPDMKGSWTRDAPLPGGDFPVDRVGAFIDRLQKSYPFLAPGEAGRMFHAYGTDVELILNGARSRTDLGKHFGPLTEREVNYLREREWAETADDILWRRSKLGLHISHDDALALGMYLETLAS
jgi:glycerol-3-phosphate dehydrogenase